MQIETLRVFCDLVETESFSVAAERNGVTQSAVSQRISALEREFGVVLLERGKRNFALTPEGTVFLEASREILEIYRGVGERFQELQNRVAGPLHLATVESAGFHELPPYVKEYRRLFPDVDLQIAYRRANQIYTDVFEGAADLGFVAYPKDRKGLIVEADWRDQLVLICSPRHELAKRPSVRLPDLEGLNFISFEPDLPTRNAIDAALKEAGVAVKETMEFDNIETVKRAVEIEHAVSLVPKKSVVEEVNAGLLCAIDVESEAMWRPLGILRKRNRAVSPAMREFVRLLKKQEVL